MDIQLSLHYYVSCNSDGKRLYSSKYRCINLSFFSSFVCLLELLHSRYKRLKLQRMQFLDYFRAFQLHSSRITKSTYGFVFFNTYVDYNSSTIAVACLICYNMRSIYHQICSKSLPTSTTSSKVWACIDSLAVIGHNYI